MNDDMLSQEEINALLNGMDSGNDSDDSADSGESEENKNSSDIVTENYLSSIEQDALGEIGNISFGSSATALSTLLNQKVEITTPQVEVVDRGKLSDEFPKPHVAITVEYTAGFEGLNLFVIKTSDAAIIADLMMGNDGTNPASDLGEMEKSAVQEAMNQMMGSASTSMSTIFNKKVDISPPEIDLMNLKENPNEIELPDEDILVKISFDIKVGDLIDSKLMQLVTITFAKNLVEELMNPGGNEEDSQLPLEEFDDSSLKEEDTPPAEPVKQQVAYEQPVRSNEMPQHVSSGPRDPERQANVQPAAFSNFETPSLSHQQSQNLDLLLDIPLEVTVELGRTKRSIREILELAQGSIVELDKLAGEPVDILVNQRLIAKGEVVVIDENFGVRVTDIVSQKERLNRLR